MLQTAAGGQRFSKIDLVDAYLQVELDDESRKYVVLATHKGLFRINRLAFDLSAAPAIFQSIIEQILRPIARAQPYLAMFWLPAKQRRSTSQTYANVYSNCATREYG